MSKLHFNIGQFVHHKVSGAKGMITGILYRSDTVRYLVSWDQYEEQECFLIELSAKPQFNKTD